MTAKIAVTLAGLALAVLVNLYFFPGVASGPAGPERPELELINPIFNMYNSGPRRPGGRPNERRFT